MKRESGTRKRRNRALPILVLGILTALAIALLRPPGTPAEPAGPAENLRLPVSQPQLEPDRPDLIGEPRIDETGIDAPVPREPPPDNPNRP